MQFPLVLGFCIYRGPALYCFTSHDREKSFKELCLLSEADFSSLASAHWVWIYSVHCNWKIQMWEWCFKCPSWFMQASLLLQRHCTAAEHFGQPGLQYCRRSGGGQLQSILFYPLHCGGDASLQRWQDKVFILCRSFCFSNYSHLLLGNATLSFVNVCFNWPSLCRCGDILLEVNGTSTWGMTHTALVRLLKELRGKITLTIVSWPGSLL